jgi:hypothetical protein
MAADLLHYFTFDASDDADGTTTLQAVAATAADRHVQVLAEAQRVLDWAWRLFPHSHGPIEDGHDWLHDLQITVEDGHWQVVTLTLAASPRFVDAFAVEFGLSPDGSEA